jgi:hypothetical protein
MPDQPIAGCTLGSTGWRTRRKAWAMVQAQLRSKERTDSGIRFIYPPNAGLSQELEALVRAERQCCSHLAWNLTKSRDELVLEVGVRGSNGEQTAGGGAALVAREPGLETQRGL